MEAPEKMGDWNFYNIGATTLKALKGAKIIPDRDYEEYEGKKPDALIVKKPIAITHRKTSGEGDCTGAWNCPGVASKSVYCH